MSDQTSLILASASPRRQELLQQIGVSCRLAPQNIDETPRENEAARALVVRLAREKAAAALQSLSAEPMAVVLASDTIVVVDDQVLGKPDDAAHAGIMLQKLSGRTHEVMTAVTVASHQRAAEALSCSAVTFRRITVLEAEQYWQTGEPQGKAGGYAIQGYGAVFVEHLQGSYSGVMGLPLFETAALLNSFNIPCWQVNRE